MAAATAYGADVSALQATGDWSKYDLAFLIAKASEGQTTRDARFASHIATARAKGLVPGGYHFGWPVQAVAKEAANYTAAVKTQAASGMFTHWLDLEAYSDGRNVAGMTGAQIKAWATSWVAAVKKAFPGQRVGAYASLATFQAGWVPTNADAYWVAQYPVAGLTWAQAAARTRPSLPKGYPAPLVWQFASSNPALDRDLAYLSKTDLAAWAAGEEDDVALSTDDINKIAAAVWAADVIPAARPPHANDDYKTNPTWTAKYGMQAAVEAARTACDPAPVTLSDDQVAALGQQLATSATFATAVAEQVADLIAQRLQS